MRKRTVTVAPRRRHRSLFRATPLQASVQSANRGPWESERGRQRHPTECENLQIVAENQARGLRKTQGLLMCKVTPVVGPVWLCIGAASGLPRRLAEAPTPAVPRSSPSSWPDARHQLCQCAVLSQDASAPTGLPASSGHSKEIAHRGVQTSSPSPPRRSRNRARASPSAGAGLTSIIQPEV